MGDCRVSPGSPWSPTICRRPRGGHRTVRLRAYRETTHDIHVASVYLWYRANHPEVEHRFVPEDEFMAWGLLDGGKIPDAIIFSESELEEENIIIDFGGSYSKAKLERLHSEYAQICRYQIW